MTDTNIVDDMPDIERYSIVDCEMLIYSGGPWMQVRDLHSVIEWLTDDDDREVMLTKLGRLKAVMA